MTTTTTNNNLEKEKEKEKEKIYPSYTELRIYPSFTEIREKFNAPQNFKMYFPREVYDQIESGSLSIEGIDVQSQNAVTKANNLENQLVYLRRPREDPIQCQMIRPNDFLLKDLQTGRFLRAQEHQLEYVQIPEEEGTEVTFALKHSGEATLSYLIRGITWSPRYNFKLEENEHQFEAWADMTNQSKRDYKIKRIELFGGDVQLEQTKRNFSSPISRCCLMKECSCSCVDGGSINPRIQSEGELGGLYFYSIDQSFVLIQQSTYSLPFVQVNLNLEKFSALENSFQETNQKGKFHRKYQIESDQFLPRGLVTIRENGRIVGQTQLNDLSKGEKQILDCGNDSDLTFHRQIQLLKQQRDSAQYQIRLTITNSKNQSVHYQYKEIISAIQFEILPQNDDENLNQLMKILPQGLQIEENNFQSYGEKIFLYQIHFQYRNSSDQIS